MVHKPVVQEDSLGCGIACVAFVCGVDYKTAKRKYFRNISSIKRGYFCKDIVKALKRAKRDFYYKYIRKTKFAENMIVFIKRSKRYPLGHYLVKTKDGWMDPWMNFNRHKPYVKDAKGGFRKRIPGKPIYAIIPK